MYTLLQSVPVSRLFSEQLPVFAVAFIIAERFYKFHSFTLECIAFLVTWYLIDGGVQLVRGFLNRSDSK